MTYQNDIFYKGTLKKRNVKGKDKVIEENINLSYDEEKDCFYYFDKVFSYDYSLKLEREKLTEEEISIYQKIIEDNTFPYQVPREDGKLYIDESSIIEFLTPNQGRKR